MSVEVEVADKFAEAKSYFVEEISKFRTPKFKESFTETDIITKTDSKFMEIVESNLESLKWIIEDGYVVALDQ